MKSAPFNPLFKIFLKPAQRLNFSRRGMQDFYRLDFDHIDNMLREKPSHFWEENGEKMAIKLFREASRRVPAYKDFLLKNNVNPRKIKTISDFKLLPIVDKKNYLRAYPVKQLCWDGKIETNTLFSVSSGSSGTPFFWPRGDNLELETSITHGLILKKIFAADQKTTLFIDTFSMGIYIAGIVILNSALRASQTGMPITIMAPGVEIDDVLRVVRELAPNYEQVILAGYPPFVKDIIDAGERTGVDWKSINVKFLFAAENFSENFRDYMFQKTGVTDLTNSSCNIYGSADASILSHETPLTISLRRAAQNRPALFTKLFGDISYTPTFTQYNPILKYFEEVDGELIFSTYGGIPLIRYNIHDSGKIIGFNEIYPLLGEISEGKIDPWKLPFLYVLGKSDLTISFYGVKIYPENIRTGLEQSEAASLASGKFTMASLFQPDQTPYWEINVELKEGIEPTAEAHQKIFGAVILALARNNLEFGRLKAAIAERANPVVTLFHKGDPKYFDVRSVKQRWSKKPSP